MTEEAGNLTQALLGAANLLVLVATAVIVRRYTKYTSGLLAATRAGNEVAQRAFEHDRVNRRPFVILTMAMDTDDARHAHLYVRNVGHSVAVSVVVDEYRHGELVRSHRRSVLSAGGSSRIHRYEVTRDAATLVRSTEYAIRYKNLAGEELAAPTRVVIVGRDDDWLAWKADLNG